MITELFENDIWKSFQFPILFLFRKRTLGRCPVVMSETEYNTPYNYFHCPDAGARLPLPLTFYEGNLEPPISVKNLTSCFIKSKASLPTLPSRSCFIELTPQSRYLSGIHGVITYGNMTTAVSICQHKTVAYSECFKR